ncbi:MAG: 2-C-methyl-D-erythritol 4-phosphate cytidylyltransferase [Actinomycetota bacterium]
MGTTAIVLAGGQGTRFASPLPKQLTQIAGKPLFLHSLDIFEASPAVDSMVLVMAPATMDWPRSEYRKLIHQVLGGSTRQGSVARGLGQLPESTEVVLVHDSARPLLTGSLIDSLLAALSDDCSGAVPGVPLEDSLKRVGSNGLIDAEIERAGVWRVQTPQAFLRRPLEEALRRAEQAGADSPDCSCMLTRAGYRVRVVEGDPLNLKITRPGDLKLAELIIRHRMATAPRPG